MSMAKPMVARTTKPLIAAQSALEEGLLAAIRRLDQEMQHREPTRRA